MTSRQRVIACCERKSFDRIPIKHEATSEVNRLLCAHFGLVNDEQLLRVVGDDFRYVEPLFCGPRPPKAPDGSLPGYFGERYHWVEFDAGKYLEACHLPFAGIHDPRELDRSRFPTADWLDCSTIARQARSIREEGFAVCCGSAGDMDFINGIARARGMEQVLVDLIEDNPVYLEIMEARFRFYLEVHRRMLEEAGGLIDFAHVGEDLGNQLGPMIGLDLFERHFAPRYQEYFAMVHEHGARTIMHMCGTVWRFLPRLLELGLDVYDVVQPTVPENDVVALGRRFGKRLIFQGSMDVQRELAFGTPAEVEAQVRRRLEYFRAGGLILGPTHRIQPLSPLENVLAMYRAAGSLTEAIPPSGSLPFGSNRGARVLIPDE